MNKHKCDIDFEKHTALMHVQLLVEKTQLYTRIFFLSLKMCKYFVAIE